MEQDLILYILPVGKLAWKAGIIFVIPWFYNGFSEPCTSTTLVRADVWLQFNSWLSCKLSVRWYNVMFICSVEVVILREHNYFNNGEAETSCRSNGNWKLHRLHVFFYEINFERKFRQTVRSCFLKWHTNVFGHVI